MKSPNDTPCNFDSVARKRLCHPTASLDWGAIESSRFDLKGLSPLVRVSGGRWLVDSFCTTLCLQHIPIPVSGELKWTLHSIKLRMSSGHAKKIVLDAFECVALMTIAEIVPWTTLDDRETEDGYPILTCRRPAGIERLALASRLDFVEGAVVIDESQGLVTFGLTGGEHQP